MDKTQHKNLTNWVLEQVAKINPYTQEQGRIAWVWAVGFLASYLARILAANPRRLEEFQDLIKNQQRKNRLK